MPLLSSCDVTFMPPAGATRSASGASPGARARRIRSSNDNDDTTTNNTNDTTNMHTNNNAHSNN